MAGDGTVLCFPREGGCKGISLNAARTLVKLAKRKGVHLLFWRPEMQGLPRFTIGSKTVLVSPFRRKYQIVGTSYLNRLIRG